MPFEKEININLVYFSCWKHVNEMVLGDPRQAHQRTQSFHFSSSFINHSYPAAQAPSSLCLHALEHSTGSERVDAFGRHAVEVIICMITRDFRVISIDVSSVSLSLYYYSQTSLTHNIGSASALPIIKKFTILTDIW